VTLAITTRARAVEQGGTDRTTVDASKACLRIVVDYNAGRGVSNQRYNLKCKRTGRTQLRTEWLVRGPNAIASDPRVWEVLYK
jgi:hypothetical protein